MSAPSPGTTPGAPRAVRGRRPVPRAVKDVDRVSTRLPAALRRRQLLDVAMGVFAERGFHDASMNDIAV
jgi:AcrR family transcriptional regulator